MEVGQIVICTDARLSEGRLREGWRYVVEEIVPSHMGYAASDNAVIPRGNFGLILVGCPAPGDKNFKEGTWKSPRFRPLTRKEVEDQVNQKIADKIMEKSWK